MPEGLRGRLVGAFVALMLVVVDGTFGYYVLGDGDWSLGDCLYMTVITLTTVGYAEVLPGFPEHEHARTFTVILIVLGMGVFVYFASTLTASIIEGDLRRALRLGRMRSRIGKMRDHIIVCGVGSTGRHVVNELIATGTPAVAVDRDGELLEALAAEHPRASFTFVVGDATEDEILAAANLERAAGMVAALPNDKDNLYLVVTARQSNASMRIVARCIDVALAGKLTRAGADQVVSPNHIGGMRMASEMIRPAAVRFLDQMLRTGTSAMRIEEVHVTRGSHLDGRTLADADLRRRAQVSVLAVREPGGEFVYNPPASTRLGDGMTLVVLGESSRVLALRKQLG